MRVTGKQVLPMAEVRILHRRIINTELYLNCQDLKRSVIRVIILDPTNTYELRSLRMVLFSPIVRLNQGRFTWVQARHSACFNFKIRRIFKQDVFSNKKRN